MHFTMHFLGFSFQDFIYGFGRISNTEYVYWIQKVKKVKTDICIYFKMKMM